DTNLQKQQDGEAVASAESDVQSDDVGGEEAEIAELEDSESTDLDETEPTPTSDSGKGELARGQVQGDEGAGGDDGQAGDGGDARTPGVLSMRCIEGRGAPGGPTVPKSKAEDDTGGRRGAPGAMGRRGMKTQLEWDDFERVVGKDELDEQVKLAEQRPSSKRG